MYNRKVLKEIVKEAGKDRVRYLVFRKSLKWLRERGESISRERLVEQLGKLGKGEYEIRGTCAYYGPVEEKDAKFKLKKSGITLRHILKMLEQGGEYTPEERRRRFKYEPVGAEIVDAPKKEYYPSHLHPEVYGIGTAISVREELERQGLAEKSKYVYPTIMVYNPRHLDYSDEEPIKDEEMIWKVYGLITND